MSEHTPEEQATAAIAPTLDERLAELESRIEGIELLLADFLKHADKHPITAPDAARLAAEERYGSSPSIHNKGGSNAASR